MTAAAALLVASASMTAAGAEAPPPLRVAIITGRDYPGHVWRSTAPALREVLEKDPRFEVRVIEDPDFLESPALGRYDVIFLHFMNWECPSPGEKARANLLKAVEGGKGLFLLHFACGAFDDWPRYRDLAGKVWDKKNTHDPRGPFRVDVLKTDHPALRGLEPFETDDELYIGLAGERPVEVLATARSKVTGKDHPMAFAFPFGSGRVFHTPLGHDARAILNAGAAELIRRGCLWAARGRAGERADASGPGGEGPAVAGAVSPGPLPDLDVTHIERTPRYNPIPWIYPEKGPQFQGDPKTRQPYTAEELRGLKERPEPGDPVQFTAHVANASDAPGPAFQGRWSIDGKEAGRSVGAAMGPWEERTFQLDWSWVGGPHAVRFDADPEEKVEEACEKNNSLADRTDALALQMRVTRELCDAFRRTPNKLGSRSFEDWVQRHILIMNNAFAACAYPQTCPHGILERVRVDDVRVMTKEEMQARQPQSMGCDGGWNFYDDSFPAWFDGHVGLDFTAGVDWGLIHELTHQLGIIDLYTIVVAAHWSHVRGADGQPVWTGYGGSQPCIMSGSGIRVLPDGSTPPPLTLKVDADGGVAAGEKLSFAAYSEHTAGGLNALLGKRRGHFGLYLFDIPARSSIQVLDNAGKPVPRASLKVYRQTPDPGPQSIAGAPAFAGEAGDDGVFPLGPRPFGDINTIGLNGILFVAMEARGHVDRRFLDISQFNIAKWQGNDDFVAVFRTGIPPEGAPPPVRALRCALWDAAPGKPVVLAWEPPASGRIAGHRVYRVLAPQYHSVSFQRRYEQVAEAPAGATRAAVEPPPGYAGVTDVRCFMVTAVDAEGRESGYADDRELARFAFPGGPAKVERLGEGGSAARVTLGPRGFVHLRESLLVERKTALSFRFHPAGNAPAGLILSVAGLGDVQVPLSGAPAPGIPVLAQPEGPGGGDWKEVRLELRALLDRLAREKGITPAEARTTWNDDWVITSLRFGRFAPAPGEPGEAVYELAGLEAGPQEG